MATPPKERKAKERVTITVPIQHRWFGESKKPSLIIEYLLDKLVGCRFSDDPEENEQIHRENVAVGAEIEAKMSALKKKENQKIIMMVRRESLASDNFPSLNEPKIDNDKEKTPKGKPEDDQ